MKSKEQFIESLAEEAGDTFSHIHEDINQIIQKAKDEVSGIEGLDFVLIKNKETKLLWTLAATILRYDGMMANDSRLIAELRWDADNR